MRFEIQKRSWAALLSILGMAAVRVDASSSASPLTFDSRVKAQEAIERVYYDHRIWPKENGTTKPLFEELVPAETVRKKVEMYLLESSILERDWSRPLEGKQLQAEIERIGRDSRDKGTLREIFRALGDDPRLIAECLARPILADRLLRGWFSSDERIHSAVKSEAVAFRREATIAGILGAGSGWQTVHFALEKVPAALADGVTSLPSHELELATRPFPPAQQISEVQETPEAFLIRSTVKRSGDELIGAVAVFPKKSFDSWIGEELARHTGADVDVDVDEPDQNAYRIPSIASPVQPDAVPTAPNAWQELWYSPEARYGHTSIWTGSEMIVWGGYQWGSFYLATGGRYNPVLDTWTETNKTGAPIARGGHTAIWTGTEMIIWGGATTPTAQERTGGRYNPSLDSWVATNTADVDCPSVRTGHTAVWTGTEMVVFGGYNTVYLNTGGRYVPSSNSWTAMTSATAPSLRSFHTAVWDGTYMIVWGGYGCSDPPGCTTNGYLDTGSRYRPATNSWFVTSVTGTPLRRYQHSAVWTGEKMIVWGGFGCTNPVACTTNGDLDSGGVYDPQTNLWTATDTVSVNTPSPRKRHTAVWSGLQMIVWGGDSSNVPQSDGGKYNLTNNTWSTISSVNAPTAREFHTAVWAGNEMIVWGGEGAAYYNSGARYIPVTNIWTPMALSSAPAERASHTAVWTGAEMVVWGGMGTGTSTELNTGGRFTLATGVWTPTTTVGALTARSRHTAIWTGSRMIPWGGANNGAYLGDGSRYDPVSNSWNAVAAGPVPRADHGSVWTGTKMIVWGGYGCTNFPTCTTFGNLNSGSRYDPALNTWAATGGTPPTARSLFSTVWTGTEMIAWGTQSYLNTGGRYNPTTDVWTATTTAGAPCGRSEHTAVWSGTEMIVWGGWGGTNPPTCSSTNSIDTGGRYNPTTNSWTLTTQTGAPSPRYEQNAVWTGTEMIVWGGTNAINFWNSGGRYDPATNSWTATPLTNAPLPRTSSTALWTGGEMIVWDGQPQTSTGGVFYPNTSPRSAPNVYVYQNQYSGALYDATLKAPRCGEADVNCDSGVLLDGRDNMTGGAEPNQPNTINNSCADGSSGTYHVSSASESLDRLVVNLLGKSMFLPGNIVGIDATFWAQTPAAADHLDLFYAANANSPVWNFISTINPSIGGPQTAFASYTLPVGTLQAIRGQYRNSGSAASCDVGSYNDHDDLIFPVGQGGASSNFEYGSGYVVSFDGTLSTSGSNPSTTVPNQDSLDSIVSYEWDLNQDAPFVGNCNSGSSAGVDSTASSFPFSEIQLRSLGIGDLGIHPVWLRVKDEIGVYSCSQATLNVVDTQPPSVTVTSPNGGENIVQNGSYIITWTGSDNYGIGHYEVYSCTDWNGASCTSAWTTINAAVPAGQTAVVWNPVPNVTSSACRIKVVAFDVSGNQTSDTSDNNFYIIQATTDAVKTVILFDKPRIELKYPGQGDALEAKLIELRANHKVNGVILNLDAVGAITTAYTAWDAAPTDQTKANAVTTAIQNYLYNIVNGQISTVYNKAKYLVIAGDDRIIPFRRMSDFTSIFPENTYVANVNASSTVGSAIAANKYLTDDYLADYGGDATIVGNNVIYIPDLSVGRLVESPADITKTVNTFISQDGQIALSSPSKIFVSGRDFFEDSAKDIRNAYQSKAGYVVESLLDEAGENPNWTMANLRAKLFQSPHALYNINGHADHYSFDAFDGYLSSTTLQADADVSGATAYAVGCHSGLTIAPADPNPLDLPQLFLEHGFEAYVGNTGYGWGLKPGIGYSERLMKEVTDAVLSSNQIALGDALSTAKRTYYLQDHRFDVFDEKILMEATLFGLPMYTLVVNAPVPPLAAPRASDSDGRATSRGVTVEKTTAPPELTNLPPGIIELDLNFTFLDPNSALGAPYARTDTAQGSYYQLNGEANGETDEPIQPRFLYDSKLSGTVVHGTLFTGGNFREVTSFTPAIAVPVSNNSTSTPSPAPKLSSWTPGVTSQTAFSQSPVCTPTVDTYSNLTVTTGEYRGANVERLFNSMSFVSYYSTYCDVTAPSITDPGAAAHTLSGLVATFSVQATDAQASLYRVLITYTDDQLGSGTYPSGNWQTFDLSFTSGNNTAGNTSTWTGSLTLTRNIRYVIQAVDADGNVAQLVETDIDTNATGTPYGSSYRSWKMFNVTLTDSDADGLPDAWEQLNFGNLAQIASGDPDKDGLTNVQELNLGTKPNVQDTDGDGDNDGSENGHTHNPLTAGDGHDIAITASPSGSNIIISWTADAANSFGPYYVYRGTSPFFAPGNLLGAVSPAPTIPLGNPATTYTDIGAIPGPSYYYWVTNVLINAPNPAILFLSPTNGSQSGGNTVSIYGDNFVSGSTVTIGGGTCLNFLFVNSSNVTCTAPSHAGPGAVDVTITSPNQQFGTMALGYTYN